MPYRKQFLDAIKQGAIDGWHKHKILPSIAGVQALHESDYGRSSLAKAPNYNIFGIKASADWKGAIVSMPTKEHVNGRTITVQANFRKYDSWGASVADYGSFFTSTEWRKNNYRHVVGERDYKKAARALQNSGYATDPQYANKLIKRLEENGLQAWDADIDKVPTGTANKISVGGNLTQAGRDYLKSIPVTVLGDSLGVGTQPKLKEIMDNMTYSVHGSRQLTHSSQLSLDATRMLEGMLSQPEKVRNNLVVIIGTNAGLVRSDVDKFIKIAGNRKIYWVNTASKGVINQARRDNVTNEIRRAAETYSNVYLLDWDKFSAPNWSSYYGGDSVHMNATGYTKHAEFIAQGIYEVLNSKQTEAPSIPKEQRDDDGVQLKKSYIGIENIEYDDGRFYTLKGESSIQDREANLRFSRHHSSSFGWITRPANFDLDNPNELFTEALAKLKEYSEPKIDYEVPTKLLPNSIDIGDWVDIIDHQYTPPLYVKAQVKSMRESETDEDGNVATLANYQAVESGLAAELIETQKKLKLIENSLSDENKIELSILSSQGAVFDGDITSTLLTAQLKLNGEIMTNYADSYVWWRVVDPLSEEEEWIAEGGPSLTVYETEFKHNAIYKVLAKKDGRVLSEGRYGLAKVVSGTHTGAENPVLAIDGETWTKPDGTQWVKKDGEWEERVDQAQLFSVRGEVEGAIQEAEQAKEDAQKAFDDAVAEAERLVTESDNIWQGKMDDFDEQVALIDASATSAQTKADQALRDVAISTDLAQTAKDLATTAQSNATTAISNASQAISDASGAVSQALSAFNLATSAKTDVSTISLDVDDLAGQVSLKASQTEVDTVKGTVNNHTADISANAQAIQARLTSTQVNSLVDGKGLATATYVNNQITATADGILTSLENVNMKVSTGNLLGTSNLSTDIGVWTTAGTVIGSQNTQGFSIEPNNDVTINRIYASEPWLIAGRMYSITLLAHASTAGAILEIGNLGDVNNKKVVLETGAGNREVSVIYTAGGNAPLSLIFSKGYTYRLQNISLVEIDKNSLDIARTEISTTAKGIRTDISNLQSSIPNQITTAILTDKSIKDTRNDNRPPSWYRSTYPNQSVEEFKILSVMGLADALGALSAFGVLKTVIPRTGTTGGTIQQTLTTDDMIYTRRGYVADTQWSEWEESAKKSFVNTTIKQEAGRVEQLITDVKDDPKGTITGYNQLVNTVDSMSQTIGTDGGKIAQLVMTDSLFRTSISDNVPSNLLSTGALTSTEGWSANGLTFGTINNDGLSVDTGTSVGGRMYSGSYRFEAGKEYYISLDIHHVTGNGEIEIGAFGDDGNRAKIQVGFRDAGRTHTVKYTARTSSFFNIFFTKVGVYRLQNIFVSDSPFAISNATHVSQLANSWALTLKSGNDIKTQINATTNSIRLSSKLIHLAGDTLIDNATIKSAHIDTLNANKIVGNTADFNTIRTGVLTTNAITSTHINADTALFNMLFSTASATNRLVAQGAWITNANIISLNADKITAGTISADRISTTSLANVEVGGRNLIIQSKSLVGFIGGDGVEEKDDNRFNSRYVTGNFEIKVTAGEYLTWTKKSVSGDNFWRYKWMGSSGGYISRSANDLNKFSMVVPPGSVALRVSYPVGSEPKIERGVVATAYSLAPEDNASKDELALSGTVEIHGGNIKADTLDVGAITGNYATFMETLWQATNSRVKVNGGAIRIDNSAGDFASMNAIPEFRSQDANGTASIMGKGRSHYYSGNQSRFYIGSSLPGDEVNGSTAHGVHIAKGQSWGIYRHADSFGGTPAQYYNTPTGWGAVQVVEELMRLGYVSGNFTTASAHIRSLNGWGSSWPVLQPGDPVLYKEAVPGNTSGIERIWTMGTASGGTTRVYSHVHHVFEGGTTGSSDRRLKHDIEPTQVEALGHIESLAFKGFRWNRDNKHEPLGLIAQDSGIIRVPDEEMEGIDIQRAIMLGLKGVQELQEIVKEQAAEIKQLKEIINQ